MLVLLIVQEWFGTAVQGPLAAASPSYHLCVALLEGLMPLCAGES